MTIAIVSPVYRTGATLAALAGRLDACLAEPWVLRLVVDACPDGGADAALAVAETDPRVRVTVLPHNVGQHRAIVAGLAAEGDADLWVTLDSDLQDPPEAIPLLVRELRGTNAAGVFAGRRGSYEAPVRRITGQAHRAVVAAVTGLPADAGAYVAMDRRLREEIVDGVLRRGCPSVVVAAARVGLRVRSIPVARHRREYGESAWTSGARLRQSAATIRWSIGARTRLSAAGPLPLARQVAAFATVGIVGTLAYLVAYAVLRSGMAPEAANAVARIGVAVPSTWLQGRVAFGTRVSVPRLLLGTGLVLLLTTALSGAVLALEQEVAGPADHAGEAVAVIVGQAVATSGRFLALRHVLFRAVPAAAPIPAPTIKKEAMS